MPRLMGIAIVLWLASCKREVQEPGHPAGAKVEASFNAKLKGSIPSHDPKRGVAFIRSTVTNAGAVAVIDEPITDVHGKPCEEFAGWKLIVLSKDRATFSNGTHRVSLPH